MSPSRSERFLASQPDDRLVALARARDERAFAAIVERYRPELLTHARRLATDGRAEDVVQQAFLSAFAALGSGAEVRHLRGWLYRIVRNETISSHRPLDASLEDVAVAGEPLEDVVAQRALAFRALSELGRLPGRQREALVGTALQGRGRSEIASAMGLSEGAVRQLVHRARTALRTAVTALIPYPLARWLGAIRAGAEPSADVSVSAGVASAGAASAGGVALKLGALVASGVVATGIVVDQSGPRHAHRAPSRGSAAVHHSVAGPGPRVIASASLLRRTAARVPLGPVVGHRASGAPAEDRRPEGSGDGDSSASSGRGPGPSGGQESSGGSDSRGGPGPGDDSSHGGVGLERRVVRLERRVVRLEQWAFQLERWAFRLRRRRRRHRRVSELRPFRLPSRAVGPLIWSAASNSPRDLFSELVSSSS